MRTHKYVLTALMFIFSPVYLKCLASDTIRNIKNEYRSSNKRSSDIIHTKLNVKFDWENSRMHGEAVITARPYFKASDKLILDARGMEIKSLEVYEYSNSKNFAGKNADVLPATKLNSSFTYKNDSIQINLGRSFTANEKYIVRINYTARPEELKTAGSAAISDDKGLYFINPKGKDKNKMPQIWTQGETQANSAWFPTIDSPNEKMTNEILMTVEDKYTTLSNGTLIESKKNADGTRTDHWKMDQPHSPYLLMMGVGEFKKVVDQPWNGKEISYYVEKEYEPYAKEIFGNTREMIDFYSKVLGTPYPWQKYSQIVVRDYVSGAMENTSATLHGDFMVYQTSREMIDGKRGEDVIAHELFHQWFGDLVTAESWSNLPLNESFATYGEYLWQEYKNGSDAADDHGEQSKQGYFASANGNEVDLIRFHYHDKEDMFDAFSYNKGGQVLHMLRKYTGDDAFFASLKLYLDRNKFKSAEIHDLRLAFEEVTGEDLNWFFNQWFLAKGHPDLEVIKTYNAANGEINLKIKQKQDLKQFPLYVLPVDIDLYFNDKPERKRIVINSAEQEFIFPVTAEPKLVNFDAERQLLGKIQYKKTSEELVFQYHHAPLYLDRNEALTELASRTKEKLAVETMITAVKSDRYSGIRANAVRLLKEWAKEHETEISPLMVKVATEDKATNVRSEAIQLLSENYTGNDLEELMTKGLEDQSYLVMASSLNGLAALNGPKAITAAEKLMNEKNSTVSDAVASVLSMGGNENHVAYFHERLFSLTDFKIFEFFYSYSSLVRRIDKVKVYAQFYDDTRKLSQSENKTIARYMSRFIKGELLPYISKKAESSEEYQSLKEKMVSELR